jgi:hypothetical protein
MLNSNLNKNNVINNLLLPENTLNSIISEYGGSRAYKNVKIDDTNLNLNNVNLKYYSSYRRRPKTFEDTIFNKRVSELVSFDCPINK